MEIGVGSLKSVIDNPIFSLGKPLAFEAETMHPHKNRFALFAAFFAFFLISGFQNAAWAGAGDDDCSSNPAPAAVGTNCVGGYNCPNAANSFNNNYANSAQQVVQKRGLAKFSMLMDSDSIDAKAHYCWSLIEAAFDTISFTANPKNILWALIKAAITAIISDVLMQACTTALGYVKAVLGLISIFESKLCLPIPKLKLPHFPIPAFGSGTCKGTSLANMLTLNGSGANKNATIYWKLWNKTGAQ